MQGKERNRYKYHNLVHNRFFFRFLWMFVRPVVVRVFRVKSNLKAIEKHLGSYILIANHTSVIDPFLIQAFVEDPLHFIVSDTHFRSLFLRKFIMQPFACISKKKNQHDNKTIREIMYVLTKRNEPIAIFPEGVNTWDGHSNSVIASTASLIRLAQVPVLHARIHGAYLTWPRWATKPRSCGTQNICVTFRTLLTKSQIHSMKKNEIQQILAGAMEYEEFQQQKIAPILFYSPFRAEYVERVIFLCPQCDQIQSIVSSGQHFFCTCCSNKWYVTREGFFQRYYNAKIKKHSVITKIDGNMATWNRWQRNRLKKIIKVKPKGEVIFYDENCVLRYGAGTTCLVMTLGKGRLSLTPTHVRFFPYNNKYAPVSFSIAGLLGVNVQNNEKLEWSKNKLVYQIKPIHKYTNTYKYLVAIEYLRST